MAKNGVNKLQVFIDPLGNTVNVWWDDPKKSVLSEEAERSWDVICLDKRGRPIGFEKIGFFPDELDAVRLMKTVSGASLSGKVAPFRPLLAGSARRRRSEPRLKVML